MVITIDPDVCRLCARCTAQRACRGAAILWIDRDEAPLVDAARCKYCLVCVDKCPYGAVVTRETPG